MASVNKRDAKSPWQVRYLSNGKHRSKSFATKKQADRFAHEIEADAYAGVDPLANDKMTVERVCDLYLKVQEDRVRDGRIGRTREYQIQNLIRRSVVPFIGKLKISSLTSAQVEQFYTDMVRKQKLSPATARDRIQDLGLITRFAIARGFLKKDPVPDVCKGLRGIAGPKIRFLMVDEVQAIVRALEDRPKGQNERCYMLIKIYVHLALTCGLRLGEINGLKAENVDTKAGVLRVKNSLTQFNELKGPKTKAGVREVALTRHLSEMLSDWARRFYIDNPQKLLFRTRNNTRIPNSDFHSVYWLPMLKRAGLDQGDKPHFHALRHFFASWLIKNGMALPDVAAAMGHSRVSTTLEIYTHTVDSAASHLDELRRHGDRLFGGPVLALPAPPCEAQAHR